MRKAFWVLGLGTLLVGSGAYAAASNAVADRIGRNGAPADVTPVKSVPEPAAGLGLLAITGVGLLLRRRRR